MDIVQETPVETPTQAEPVAEPSLSDHEAEYANRSSRSVRMPQPKPAPEPAADIETPAPVQKHRAASKQASPEDVAEIASLTKTLREKEAALGKLKPEAVSGAPRVLTLKRQIAAIEAELAGLTPKPAAPTAEPAREQVASPTPSQPAQMRPMPVYDAAKYEKASPEDPWQAYQDDRMLWLWEKRNLEAQQQTSQQQAEAQQLATARADADKFAQRMHAYDTANPGFKDKFQAMWQEIGGKVPVLLGQAIMQDEHGPRMLDAMVQDPAFRDDMLLLSQSLSGSDANVALLRRRLTAQLTRTAGASTGSSPALPKEPPPRPPNPVRTGAIFSEPELPGEDAPLSEHERVFSKRRRA